MSQVVRFPRHSWRPWRFELLFPGSMQSTLPDWVAWLAQDADGTWWAYEACPNRHDSGWYENELGRCTRLYRDNPNPDWMHSLRQIDAR